MLPSVPEIMGDQFRTAVSGKDAFPVAVCAHTALQGGIIGEVPCLFPDKKVSSVEGLAVHFIKFYLKFFTPHFRRTVMEPGESIGAVFGHHHGFSDLFPEIQFQIPGVGSSLQITGEIVPSVITVETDHIHGPGHNVLLVIILAADKGHGAVLRIQPVGKFIERMPVIVGGFREMLGIRFVSHGPHDDAGMIFVSHDQIPQDLLVMLSYGKCLIRITALSGTDAHGGRLVNNNDTFSVTEPVDLLRVRVMAGAEGVGMDPV